MTQIDVVLATHHTDRIAAALQFPLYDPVVASVLISAADPELVSKNLAAFGAPVDRVIFDATATFAL